MPKKPNSRTLRQLAENVARQLIEQGDEWRQDRGELATSLVRQWITYDGNATLFQGERQFHFALGHTPLGKASLSTVLVPDDWLKQVAEGWKIDAEDLPDVIDQLNRGQSAEVTNTEGLPLRLWVNPKEKGRGVEPLVKQPLPPQWKRDYLQAASTILKHHFGALLDASEMEELAVSVARQWQRYQGHACLFVGSEQFALTLTEMEEGNCSVTGKRSPATLEPLLCSLGLPSEDVPEAVARINLDQEVEFRDRYGVRSRLWHDPRTSQLYVRPVGPVSAPVGNSDPPLACPRCSALLRFWQVGERQQVCPCCAHVIALVE